MDTFTIEDFYQISEISSDETLTPLEQQTKTLQLARPDLSEEEIEELTIDEFEEITKGLEFSLDGKIENSFTLDNIEYTLKGNSKDFDFTVRQMLTIQNKIKNDQLRYLHWMMAVLYDCDVFDVNKRAEVFLNNLPVKRALPFVKILMEKYNPDAEILERSNS
jgi:hypothetical protein